MGQAASSLGSATPHGRAVGRYLMFGQIGSGGTATVHFGRLQGPDGFARTVALKRLHPHLASDPYFVSLLLSEARLAARINHPNVVSLLDVVRLGSGEVLLVMDYVHGETLAGLLGAARHCGRPVPPPVVVAVMSGALHGLHAAHDAVNEVGAPLDLVHGDVSPHNIIVGEDGTARLVDFGVAPALDGRNPSLMGTLAYMAPERLRSAAFDRRSDVFGAGAVLWEMLALERLFPGQAARSLSARPRTITPPSRLQRAVPEALDPVVLRALAASEDERYPDALELAAALERACPPASNREVAAWVTEICGPRLRERAAELARIASISAADADGEAWAEAHLLEPTAIDSTIELVGAGPDQPPSSRPSLLEEEDEEEALSEPTPVKVLTPAPEAIPESETDGVPERMIEWLPARPQAMPERRPLLGDQVSLAMAPRSRTVRTLVGWRFSVAVAGAISVGGSISWLLSGGDEPPRARMADMAMPPPIESRAVIEPLPRSAADTSRMWQTPPGDSPADPTAPLEAGIRLPKSERAIRAMRRGVLDLNRRAIAAYERLDPQAAVRLLDEALRRAEGLGPRGQDLVARTHTNLGVVLAAGLKDRDLAARHFRQARALVPHIAPPPALMTPEVEAALIASSQ
jgi:serine/threonine-protein kinase